MKAKTGYRYALLANKEFISEDRFEMELNSFHYSPKE